MRNCVGIVLGLAGWLFAACAASTETMPTAAAKAPAARGIDCPCCFTIIETMRTGPRHQGRERVTVRCEHCCESLTFTTAVQGQLFVATTADPTPLPCELCAPAPMR